MHSLPYGCHACFHGFGCFCGLWWTWLPNLYVKTIFFLEFSASIPVGYFYLGFSFSFYLKCNTFSFRQSPLSIICISIIWSLALLPEAGIPFYHLQHTWYLSSLFFSLTLHFFFIFVPFLPTHCVVCSLTALHLDNHHSFRLMPLLSSSLCSNSTCICHQMSILKMPVIQESPIPPLINDQLFILPLKALTVWFILPFQHSLLLFIFLNRSLWLHRFPTVFWICPVLTFTYFASYFSLYI